MTYKKRLSIFELKQLAKEEENSIVFVADAAGKCKLESWLKNLRFQQAWQIAEMILKREITEQEFQECWKNTPAPKAKSTTKPATPNTATFGGYRLKNRTALNRDEKKVRHQPTRKRK